jgi:hypothetical protein
VRGDLKAVIRAILTDVEARDAANAATPTYGKLREPVIRMAHVLRAYKATSTSGKWLMGSTTESLAQSPLTSPSVFNFWRPGYVPPNTTLGNNGFVAPEFQGVNEITLSSYINTMQSTLSRGTGDWLSNNLGRDIQINLRDEAAFAGDVQRLTDHANRVLLNGQMSPLLRQRIFTAVAAINISTGSLAQINENRLNRVRTVILLTMASPEYLAQR